MNSARLLRFLIPIIFFVTNGNGFKILIVFPTRAPSHYFVGRALAKGLAEAGHEVTMVCPFKKKETIPNYKEVVLDGIIEALKKGKSDVIAIKSINTSI